MSNSTSDFLSPLENEVSSIDYQWAALEVGADILCVSMALYVGLNGAKKIWPYHEGYAGTKKGFIWLAARWGVGNYPHLFQLIIGLSEVFVFAGCMMCFIPLPFFQLWTCVSFALGMAMCLAFLITHSSDPLKLRLTQLWYFTQAATALAIKLFQDFPWADPRSVTLFKVATGGILVGFLFMVYRRLRFGKVPDPLLG